MTEKRLVFMIKFLIYLSFLAPLIVMADSFIFPFVFSKAIFFRILAEMMLGLYLILCLVNKEYRPKKTFLLFALGFLFFVLFLSALFGVDFQRSFWGNHERMSGWFTLIHFGLYFLIIANVFKGWPEWRQLLRWSLFVSFVVGLTGFNFLLPEDSVMRIDSGGSLGNKIYLANFILFHIFIAWLLFRKEEKLGWKIFAATIGFLEILIMIYNGKRGPFLGLLAGLFVGILLYSIFTKVKKWQRLGFGLIILAVILGGLVFFNRQNPLIQKIPIIGGLANISLQSGTGATRLIAWEIALKAWQEKPIFGWGIENFYYAFNKYYNPKSLEYSYYETWFDRSHNIFLDYLSTSGILGVLTYLGIFAAVFYGTSISFKKKTLDLDRLVFFSMFFIAYASQNLFVFDHLSAYLIFFAILAFVDFSVFKSDSADHQLQSGDIYKSQHKPFPVWSAFFIILAVTFLVYKTNIQPALANNHSLKAQTLMGENFALALEDVKKILQIPTPHLTDIRMDLSRTILSLAAYPEALKSDVYKQAVNLMIEETERIVKKRPLELNAYLILGRLYTVSGDLDKAEQSFITAQKLSPSRQQTIYLLSKIKAARKDFSGAIDILQKTIADNPNIPDSYWYLSMVYYEMGEKKLGYDNLIIALDKGKKLTQLLEVVFVGDLLKEYENYERSIQYYERALSQIPNHPQLLLSLSENYALLGNQKKAREMAEQANLYDPQALGKARAWLK